MNPPSRRRFGEASLAAMLFGVAVLARALYLFIHRPTLESYYLGLANSLLSTGVLGFGGTPSTAFEPVYPFFLASARLIFGDRIVLIQLLQVCVAAAGAVLLYYLALQLTLSRRTATWAGAMFALHPLLMRQASGASDLAVTTTLVIAFALAFARIHDPRSAAMSGLILGVTVLTRSMVLPVVVLAAAILLLRGQRLHAVALTLAVLLVVAPMIARTYALSGSLTPTRNGVALYVGNSPHSAALLPTYDLDLLEPEAYERFTRARPDIADDAPSFDAVFDDFLTRAAVQHMAEDPARTIRQKLLNVAFLVSPWIVPLRISGRDTRLHVDDSGAVRVVDSVARSRSEIAAHAVTSMVLLVGCAAGVYLRRRELQRDAILWAIVVTFVIVNAMYVPATRYTAPMQFVLIFYSAVAIARLREGSRNAAVA